MWRILVVDDEENILSAIRRGLKQSGRDESLPPLQVEAFTSPQAALARSREGVAYDLVLSDYRMPEMSGIEFLRSFRELQPDAVRIILSGYADLDAVIHAINEVEIYRFLSKPWNDHELQQTIRQAIEHRNLLLENRRLADLVRVQQGKLTRQQLELRRLEEETPGITRVRWGPDGEVLLEEF